MTIISNTFKYVNSEKNNKKSPKFPKMGKNVGSLHKKWEKSRDAFILKLTLIKYDYMVNKNTIIHL
jgi:hypothetical protein